MKKTTYFIIAGFIALASCTQKQDEEDPQFDQITINGVAVGTEAQVFAGGNLAFVVQCSDNESLNQLKIDLHSDSDGHTHGDVGEGEGSEGEWEELEIVSLEGTNQSISRTYSIPETVRGEWHLGFGLIDEQGNEADSRFIDLDVVNEIIPEIVIDALNGVDVESLVLVTGELLNITGTVSDATGLSTIELHLEEEDGTELYTTSINAGGNATYDLSAASFEIPSATGSTVDFSITATDTDGNEYTWSVELSY